MKKNVSIDKTLWKVMRITLYQLLLMAVGVSIAVAHSSGAQNVLSRQVTVSMERVKLGSLLEKIEKSAAVKFVYSTKINSGEQVSLHSMGRPLSEVLDELLTPLQIRYEVVDSRILLRKAPSRHEEAESHHISFEEPDRHITGRTIDEKGEALPGVNILVKGTQQGTISDASGAFVLTVPDENAVLVFSFVGYVTQEILAGNMTNMEIKMQVDEKDLEELVVVGYGTQKKSDLTGSISSVSSDEINAFPATNVLQALAGRAAGVHITQNTGEPGGSMSVRIRGTNSIQGSNEPLYVVDGFPISGSNPTILNNLDIESIEILKDASATAIYGSRGANGVVLITTKSGNAGFSSVSLESNLAFQSIRRKMDMMNAREYAQFYNIVAKNDGWGSAFSDSEINALGEGFDWQDFVFRDNAPLHNHNLTFRGGNSTTQYSLSGSIYNEEGIIENSGYDRYSFRSNISHKVSDKIKVNGSVVLASIKQENQSSSGGGRGTSLISGALYAFPTVTPRNDDGSWRNLKTLYHWSPEINNPALMIYETRSNVRSNKVLANASIEYNPIKDLTIKIMGGIENSDDRSDFYRTNNYIGSNANASVSTTQFRSLLNENTIAYTKSVGKHRFSGLVGFTYQDFLSTSLSASGTDFLSDVTESYDLAASSVPGIPGSGYSLSVVVSGLGRLNYNYNDKYLATINFRADGSSKYSDGNKWGYFPSGSLAWRISNEEFFGDNGFITDLKFRAGWGQTGSQAIGAYATLNRLSTGKTVLGKQYHTYFAPGTNLPGDLKWETTGQTNIGMDLAVWNNRIRITADFYNKKTKDVLNSVPLPPSGGFRTTIDNIGVITNRGLELEVGADVFSGAFKWTLDGNIAFNKSRVEKLYKGQDILGSFINVTLINDHFNILREGEEFGVFYGYLEDGYDESGRLGKYKDLNGDGVINVQDKVVIGNPNPDFIYGLNSAISFKNFEFTIFLQGTYGNDIFNLAGLNNTLDVGFGGNMPREILYDHWTPENPNAKYPIPSRTNQVRVSDRFVEDGSFLRFRNIQLGYNFPLSKWGASGIKNLYVFAGGKNLITFTRYSRWDPEVNSLGGASSINLGIDYHSYPVNKSINFGIRADF